MNYQRHSFPDFQETKPASSTKRQDPQVLFKPTFQQTCGRDEEDKINRIVEQAHRQSYICGMQEGHQEGCRIAQAALSPCLNHFVTACENMAALIPSMAETMAEQVVSLAHGLCGRILGKHMTLKKMDLYSLKAQLVDKIIGAHCLVVHLHPDDINAIEDLAPVVNFTWPDGSQMLSFIKDPQQTRGQLSLQLPGDPADAAPSEISVIVGVEDLADLLGEPAR